MRAEAGRGEPGLELGHLNIEPVQSSQKYTLQTNICNNLNTIWDELIKIKVKAETKLQPGSNKLLVQTGENSQHGWYSVLLLNLGADNIQPTVY